MILSRGSLRLLLLCGALLAGLTAACQPRKPRINPMDPLNRVVAPGTAAATPTPTLASAGPDAFEADDAFGAASTLVKGVQQDHSLHTTTDLDWATFTLGQMEVLTIETLGPVGDTILELYDDSGSPGVQLNSDDDNGPGLFSSLTVMLGPGIYYVRVREKGSDQVIPAYGLTLSGYAVTATPTSTATEVPCASGLGGAVENAAMTFTTNGNALWTCQTVTSYVGGDAGKNGPIGDGQNTALQAAGSGPGTITFYWQVSSEPGWDFLEFRIDGVLKNSISGNVPWQFQSFAVASGAHTFRWVYTKDAGCCTGGSDSAWVDAVVVQ